MIILRLNNITLEPGVTHDATDWEVSDVLDFSNIIVSSIADTNFLTLRLFKYVGDANTQLYARAKPKLSTGYTQYVNLDVTIVEDVYEPVDTLDIPSVVSVPIITTDSNYNNHVPTLFNINLTGYGVDGDATLEATTWLITNLKGEIIWRNEYDRVNKTSLLFKDKILEIDNVYIIKAMFHSTSGDTSQVGSYIINVPTVDNVSITSELYYFDPRITNNINIASSILINGTRLKFFLHTSEGLEEVASLENLVNPRSFDLPANTLDTDLSYTVGLSVRNISNVWSNFKYELLSTFV